MAVRSDSKKGIIKFDIENEVDGVPQTYIAGYAGNSRKFFDKKFIVLIVLTLILLIVGITLIVLANVNLNTCDKSATKEKSKTCDESCKKVDTCAYSDEAKRISLGNILNKVKEEYHEAFPEEIAWHPDVNNDMIKKRFRVHDPKPSNIRNITVRANKLLKEVQDLKPDLSKLKPREHKAYLQTVHFLENTFAYSYLNYSAGIWLMGPSSFCSEPICYIGYSIYNSMGSLMPSLPEDIELLMSHFNALNVSIYDYIDVLKMGINKGMVRTQIECRAGIDAMESKHKNITKNGPKGAKGEWYTKRFFEESFYINVTKALNDHYIKTEGKNVSEYIQAALVTYIGKPIYDLITYLNGEHYLHCRPNNYGAGGLSALPLDVIFYNGSIVNGSTTDPTLPLCDKNGNSCRLNGSESYAAILGYFTTTNIHPNDVYNLGMENLNKLFPQVIEIAKNVTKLLNETTAVNGFQKILSNLSLSYFHDHPLPENETKGDAFNNCKDEETAKKFCPTRWAAMMKWFDFAQMAMSIHDPNTVDFFYFSGDRHSTPNCPVKLRPDFNPSSGAQSYDSSDTNCSIPCFYNIPFFLEHLGPKFSEYSVNAHEARPGHHTQVQGLMEHFRDKCGGSEGWLDDKTYYTAFTEGWALYAENPLIAQGTDIYNDNPMQKFGMLKWQIWRALRLIVDTGLHYRKMSRAEALRLFATFAWDNTDLSQKEVTRYQSNYGQATAYMIGQLDIWKLRNKTEADLGPDYNIKEFHLQALSQGSSPLAYLTSYMEKYVQCKKFPSQQYCDIVLNPTQASKDDTPYVRNAKMKWPSHRHYI